MRKTVAIGGYDVDHCIFGIFRTYCELTLKITSDGIFNPRKAEDVIRRFPLQHCILDFLRILQDITQNFQLAPDKRGELPRLTADYGAQDVFYQFRCVGIELAGRLLLEGRSLTEINGVLAFNRHMCAQVMDPKHSSEFGRLFPGKKGTLMTQLATHPFEKSCEKLISHVRNGDFLIGTSLDFRWIYDYKLDRVPAYSAAYVDGQGLVPCSVLLIPDPAPLETPLDRFFLKLYVKEGSKLENHPTPPSETCLVIHGNDRDKFNEMVKKYVPIKDGDHVIQRDRELRPIAEERFSSLCKNSGWSQDEKLKCIADIGFILCHDTCIERGGGEVPQMLVSALLERHGFPKLPDQFIVWGEVMACPTNLEFAKVLKAQLSPPSGGLCPAG